ncbi:hypothetical protein [Bacillus sp. RAR_GA_16]|uniref:hypothetical protein n=1 Tax=Bacillus sp. RAR_GA_16 TaxID=2876774 RepID=UPI001CCF5F97|nr:hypothetical protein [Bacillus sp. RAR_GA_16]MCA0173969.1 hypothetical protein [Bacillus sp. RAR_GA_16]
MSRKLPIYGLGLQMVFFLLFFSALLSKMNYVIGAGLCLILGFLSITLGLFSVKHGNRLFLCVIVIIIGTLIIGFTIFAYFLGEGGYPPLIRISF